MIAKMRERTSPSTRASRDYIQSLVAPAGIMFDGPNPWDPQIHDESILDRMLTEGSIAIGEGYMHGQWEVEDLREFVKRALAFEADRPITNIKSVYHLLRAHLLNLNRPSRARISIQAHYDLGNDFYEAMLDPSMAYSCGYWKDAENLEQAQFNKHELVCRKLDLKKGHRVLDIGCGWGAFLIHAVKYYGVQGVGITLSTNQVSLARERTRGLPIEIRLQDYREIIDGDFDRIASIGMFEHVGAKNYSKYFECAHRLLRDDGLFLVQTIGAPQTWAASDPWYDKYIFRDGYLPSIVQITQAHERYLMLEDLHQFDPSFYARTLQAWYDNYLRNPLACP